MRDAKTILVLGVKKGELSMTDVITPDPINMDSILISIKKMLGIEPDMTNFDVEIIIYINSVIMTLNQIGVTPDGFIILNSDDVWNDMIGERTDIEAIKTFIYLKVRLLFDPPSSSFVLEAMKQLASEMEWRLNVQVENKTYVPEVIVPEEV
jgi:hypothetical protein